MAEWTWGSDKKAVAMTEQDMKSVIDRVVEAVTSHRQGEALEHFKQYARAEAELVQARQALAHRDQQIHDLQARVAQLNGIITTMSQSAAPVFNPYNNNGPAPTGQVFPPTFDQRFAAATPIPQQFAPISANGHVDSTAASPATS